MKGRSPLRPLLATVVALLLGSAPLGAQDGGAAVENSEIFRELDLPTPNAYRTGSGRPGPDYWQQEVDYRIDVRLMPESHQVFGSQTITYTNHSPDSLDHLWLQLDQNLFDPTSEGAAIIQPGDRFSGVFPNGGFELSEVRVHRDGEARTPEMMVDGTVMRITLEEPLAPRGGTLELSLDFRFEIPAYGADRMGRLDVEEGTVFQLAQWYPRMFVYDDVHGWNVMPYLGQGEFYLEYGSFDVSITVPREFHVVATGTLRNPGEVLTRTQRQRLEEARRSAETVHVVREDEVGDPGIRPEGDGALTWRFSADSVRDFSWAASQAFIWDAASWKDVLVMSAYPKEGLGSDGEPGWERSTRFVRHSIRYYSEKWERYPYPVAVNVAGKVGGMEYPMISFCSVDARGQSLFRVTDHEVGHNWFPMLVGSDERRWYWMDEGLDSFMNLYSARAFYGSDDSTVADSAVMAQVAGQMRTHRGLPILTRTDRVPGDDFGYLGYGKPSVGLVLLREVVLGPERFDPAFRAYIDRWKYRHPKPADFFRTIEDVTGEELDWFWQGWFDGTGYLDQAIGDVSTSGDETRVTVEQRGDLILPARIRIRYEDGTEVIRKIPVEAWHASDAFTFTAPRGEVRSMELAPRQPLPDVDPSNDRWERGGGS